MTVIAGEQGGAMHPLVLVTKLQLGHAFVLEALLPSARTGRSAPTLSTPTKPSFADKCVPKLELGNEAGTSPALLKLSPVR